MLLRKLESAGNIEESFFRNEKEPTLKSLFPMTLKRLKERLLMTKALISIDYTVDFVADDGKLTAGAPAQAISEAIAQVTEAALSEEIISFAIDAHDRGDTFHQVNSFHHTISKELVDAIFWTIG